MKRLVLTILSILLAIALSGQKKIVGEYQSNFPTYGMFGETLKLNCDSTAILNFRGDMMNDNSYGRWKVENKTLVVIFDTTRSIKSRDKDTLILRIKGSRFYKIGWTKESYKKYQDLLNQHNKETGENLQLPNECNG
jgi:hypothetical protein